MAFQICRANSSHLSDINRLIELTKIGDHPLKKLPGPFWFVRQDGRIVGIMGGEFIEGTGIYIGLYLAVDPAYRKRGIGMALFAHALEHARGCGAKAFAFLTMYYLFNRFKRRGFKTSPRKQLPEALQNHWMFVAKRYMKCAAMIRQD